MKLFLQLTLKPVSNILEVKTISVSTWHYYRECSGFQEDVNFCEERRASLRAPNKSIKPNF